LIILLIFIFTGCNPVSQFLPREKIPEEIKRLCKEEYNLSVKTNLTDNTIWVYIPLEHLINEDMQINKDIAERIDNVTLNISRTLLNTKGPPDFFVLVASDISLGADYFLLGYTLDIMKYQQKFISREDFMSRHVTGFEINPDAVGDKDGSHIEIFDFSLPRFLAEQVAQRTELKFRSDDLKNYFEVNSIDAIFENQSFRFYVDIKMVAEPQEEIDIIDVLLKVFNYVMKNYDFEDFYDIEIQDVASGRYIRYGKGILDKLK
jgi:hypothetical protein